jgi:ABC-2 type transport system permease protein
MIEKLKRHQFLFEELVKRDFAKKYKRTILGMAWSIISPLMNLLIMWLVFSKFFGANVNHYAIYLFAGQVVFSYFTDATNLGMSSLVGNAGIFTKVNVPKYLFLFSQNISSLINFGLTLLIFFTFVAFDGIAFTWKFALLLYPIVCLIIFNLGMGLILSALFVFFRDMQYLWGILTQLIMWMSAIFYTIDQYSYTVQCLFLLNPIYVYIRYFRKIVIDSVIPTAQFHLVAAGYALVAFAIGAYMYKKNNHEFLYYV